MLGTQMTVPYWQHTFYRVLFAPDVIRGYLMMMMFIGTETLVNHREREVPVRDHKLPSD